MGATAEVFTACIVVDDGLATVAEESKVVKDWDWKEHITVEDDGTGGSIESAVRCRAEGAHGSGENGIDEFGCGGDVVKWLFTA